MANRKLRLGLVSGFMTSEYVESLIRGATTFCNENDVDLFLFPIGQLFSKKTADNTFEYLSVASLINQNNLDGIITTSGTMMHDISQEEFTSYFETYKPLKIVNVSNVLEGIPSVMVDCNQAFESLIQYLINEQGCRKFALMGAKSNSAEVKLRTDIFKQVLTKNGISLEDTVFWESDFEYTYAYKTLNDYSREYYNANGKVIQFDAIVALNDDMAFACMDYFTNRLHKRIPEDVIVTGFDNLQRASFYNPTLTSVNQQVEYQGYIAAQTLYQSIKGKEVPEVQYIRAKTILRQSTARNKDVQKNFIGNSYITVDNRTSRDFSTSFSVSEWYNRRSQLLQASNFYTGLDHDVNIKNLGNILTNQLRLFGFQAAAVVIYDNPIDMPEPFEYFALPKKAKLISGFDYTTLFNSTNFANEITFNPNEEILPSTFFNYSPKGTIITSLFFGTIQYGYIVIRCGEYDLAVYDLVQRSVSNQLSISFAYTQMSEEQTQIKTQNKKLDFIAHTDELTGMRNRRGFFDLAEPALKLSKELKQKGYVFFCDMDGLKKINDTYGHESGDIAIKAQSKILKKNFPTEAIIGRLGGDEFAIIVPELKEEKIAEIRNNVEKACQKWSEDSKSYFTLSISMGFIQYPNKKTYKLDTLLSMADKALYLEKRRKKAARKD